jgi:hypothetical protein
MYNYISASKVVLMIKGLQLFCETPDSSEIPESVNGMKELFAVQPRRYFFNSPKFEMLFFTRAGFLYPAIYETMNDTERDSARQSVSSLLQQLIFEKRNTEEPLKSN